MAWNNRGRLPLVEMAYIESTGGERVWVNFSHVRSVELTAPNIAMIEWADGHRMSVANPCASEADPVEGFAAWLRLNHIA